MTFEEKLEIEAEKVSKAEMTAGPYKSIIKDVWGREIPFKQGAHWARVQTLKDVCEWLMSEEGRKQFKINSHGCAVMILNKHFGVEDDSESSGVKDE